MAMHYATAELEQFVKDMNEAGYEVKHYEGRSFWQGPAVRIDADEEQDVIRATKVRLQSDSMGRGLIMYPVKSGKLNEA